MAFQYPQIDPYIFSIGPIKATWYGFMYVLAFIIAYYIGTYRAKKTPGWQKQMVDDLSTYLMLGVLLGGRVGYVLFYGLGYWADDWFYPLKVYQGGMSFHGGLIGVAIACLLFARKTHKRLLNVGDFVAPMVPTGLFLGRLGNFINGELWGRPTNVPWGIVFPRAPDSLPRHPSQLYEAGIEGILLFIIIWVYSAKPRKTGQITGMFLIAYGIGRFFVEFFREPDAQLGFIGANWLTMGQLLSIPMIILGLWLLFRGKVDASLS